MGYVLYLVAWFLLIAIIYIGSNIALAYLGTAMVGDLLFSIFTIMMVVTLPIIIIWFAWIFLSVFRDKEFKRMIDRGVGL